ncbi:hypothetical protein EJB05_41964 [Eragrostis curvula]|uniref:Bifunctional inhibitor/plant lipid transfer protein/seed storage helical domain-containing protein n=1 Tax=Eragrostis curvula TaxID=38414 RepID=A0A5J9TB11_9POAL|nr:hypothetical protein EJB05_41964 [Eragrostis curvula]
MMATKEILRIFVLALIFSTYISHKAWGDQECYTEKENIEKGCKTSIKTRGNYVFPSTMCCDVVRASDMVCVCRILSDTDEHVISAIKLVQVALVKSHCRLEPNVEVGEFQHLRHQGHIHESSKTCHPRNKIEE